VTEPVKCGGEILVGGLRVGLAAVWPALSSERASFDAASWGKTARGCRVGPRGVGHGRRGSGLGAQPVKDKKDFRDSFKYFAINIERKINQNK
jgi:hypothetical protein